MDATFKRQQFETLKVQIGQGRIVPEKRKTLTVKQKAQVIERQHGLCGCGCSAELTGRVEFDHRIARGLGGKQRPEDYDAVLKSCHDAKTHGKTGDIAMVAKAKRIERREVEGPKPPQIKSRNEWPKGRKIQSRGFDPRGKKGQARG